MAGTSRIRGGRWRLFAIIAVLAVAAVAGSVVMERRTLASTVDEKTADVEAVVAESLAPVLADVDLTKPLGEGASGSVGKRLDGVLAASTLRVRIYAKDGQLLYSTDEGDRSGSAKTGDADAIRGAAVGATASLVDDDRVSIRGAGAQSFELLQVYVPVTGRDEVAGVAEFDLKYKPIEAASKQPWRTIQLAAGFAAVLFLELVLFGLARTTATKRLAARSGFTGAGVKPDAKVPSREAEVIKREAEIRQALEDQLATLRTQVKKQEEESAEAAREFAAQLQATAARAQEAEAKLKATGGADAVRAATERAGLLEQQLRQAEHQQLEAQSRFAELEGRLAEAERRAEQGASTPSTVQWAETEIEEPVVEDEVTEEPAEDTAAPAIAHVPTNGPSELELAADSVAAASPADSRSALEEAAASLFPSVVAGKLRGADVADALVAAAGHVGIAEDEARRVIAAAFVARRSA